jgi:hypothetical protein
MILGINQDMITINKKSNLMVYMLNKVFKQFNSLVSPALSILDTNSANYNSYITGLVSIFLIGYASLAAPKLPRDVVEVLAGNPFVKVLFMAAIVWLFTNRRNPALAILVAVCFLITTMVLDKHRLSDIATAVQLETDEQVVVKPTEPQTETELPIEIPKVPETPVEIEIPELPSAPENEGDNEYFKDDAPTCGQYQQQANQEYKQFTSNGCNLVSQGCGIKTFQNQCGTQGLDCQPNFVDAGFAPF